MFMYLFIFQKSESIYVIINLDEQNVDIAQTFIFCNVYECINLPYVL